MTLAFICSGLEPGRDGVGDYTRKLAAECAAAGHDCGLIALNDPHLTEPAEELITTGGGCIRALRLPSKLPWSQRSEAAATFRTKARPDWISLQFVPYGYHRKGVVAGLERRLAPILGNHRVHIMFHELWLGGYAEAPWKERLVGALQRAAIVRLIRTLAPALVTTSNPAFRGMLQKYVKRVQLLELFGNIPVVEKPDAAWFEDALRKTAPSMNGRRSEYWVFVFFGTLFPVWPAEPLFSYLLEAGTSCRKRIVLASVGRLGPGEKLWDELSVRYSGVIRMIKVGEQSAERVSALLQFADFGIAASPWELVGKSGSVASMREHGLPVIVNRDEVHFAGCNDPGSLHGLTKMDSSLPAALRLLERRSPIAFISPIARDFLKQLNQIANP